MVVLNLPLFSLSLSDQQSEYNITYGSIGRLVIWRPHDFGQIKLWRENFGQISIIQHSCLSQSKFQSLSS